MMPVSISKRYVHFSWLTFLLFSLALPALARPDLELGRRLYETGIDRNGDPIKGVDRNGISYEGDQAACMRCHRRSGFGGSEGGYYVPPISTAFLFEDSRSDRNDRFRAAFLEAQSVQHWIRVRMPRARVAYTPETLATALREGTNPSGNRFDALMPSYQIDDKDMENLIAYLGTLSDTISPGVDDTFMHFAIVVSPGTDEGERNAMLSTTAAFAEWYNERLLGDKNLAAAERVYGMQFKESTRLWKFHTWELKGDPKSWQRQLKRYQKESPVFALVNGMVDGSWDPVAEFCDSERVPCLLPLTQLATHTRELGGYTVYYSRGAELEADLIAQHLHDQGIAPGRKLVQLHHSDPAGSIPARRFVETVARSMPGVRVESIAFTDREQLDRALSGLTGENGVTHDIVLWPGDRIEAIPAVFERPELSATDIYTSSRAFEAVLAGKAGESAKAQAYRLAVAWPYSMPDDRHSDSYRMRSWMRSRGVPVTHERIQFMSTYSLGIMRDALRHMFEHYYRDYFLERVEHEVDGAVNPGFYPALALGPEQRIVSKGGYVARLESPESEKLVPLGKWMVP
jgi:hypothetical protein